MTDQWRLQSMQLVNWGGFEGHHRVDLSAPSTLISGATGTGKSTMLDAYIALLMPSRVPFNGASNDNVSGRARGGDQRNVLRYMRGKIDDNRVEGSATLTDQVLRGADTPTWSAIAATWERAGRRFTAMRLYYASPSASRFDDITKRMATIDGDVDLRHMAEFCTDQFDPPQLRNRFPGIDFHGSYRSFSTAVCTQLGIGLPGEGERALGLLARIQAGRTVTTVDGLFKTMVLERPKTLAVADEVIAHFDDLQASYEAMKTAELQVETLSPITDCYQDWQRSRDELDAIGALGIDCEDSDATSVLHVWAVRTERRLLDERLIVVGQDRRLAQQHAAAARRNEDAAETQLAALRATGADGAVARLDEADRTLEHLSAIQRDTEQAIKLYSERTAVLGAPPADGTQFAAAHAAAGQFLADYPGAVTVLRGRRDVAVARHQQLQQRRQELAGELESLRGRSGVIPTDLHDCRCEVAAAIGVSPTQLPFVGELLDMAEGFADWRLAADRALGGLAITMLIAADDLERARVCINELNLARRISFEGAPCGQPIPLPGDVRRLPGRLRVDESSPFAGWLMARIVSGFDYECVDGIAELAGVERGLTVTGQTKSGRRGAHGGSRRPVIGVSNSDHRSRLTRDLADIATECDDALTRIRDLDDELDALNSARDAHRYVADTTWSGLDLAGAVANAAAAAADRDTLLAGDSAAVDGARRTELLARREDAARVRHLAQADVERLGGELRRLGGRKDELVEAPGQAVLTDELSARLDNELTAYSAEVTAEGFSGVMSRLRAALSARADHARLNVERSAKMLSAIFAAFQRQWPTPELGVDVASYPGYRDILEDLNAEGLYRRRAAFVREVNDWTGIDLLRLHGAFEEAVEDIESRLNPINGILATLAFGPGADRLHITLRRNETADISAFRRELKALAGSGSAASGDADAQRQFLSLARFIDRIRKADNVSERDHFLDVRRHVYIEAERRDVDGRTLNVYASLAGKSGGESQELIAFIVGAALRYQLGEARWPRYAPIILDEGFIKSDAAFAGRAVTAWKGLGFQLIIGAPDDKVNSIEPHVDRILCITKNYRHRSRVIDLGLTGGG